DFANVEATIRLTNLSPMIAASLPEPAAGLGTVSGIVSLIDGRVNVDLNAPVSVTGEVRPFDESPSYNLVAALRRFDIGDLNLDGLPPDLNSSITGTIRVAGTGFSKPELVVTPDLRDSRVADVEVETLTGAIALANERI